MSTTLRTILIVDDFASVRLYHSSFLTRKGFRCLGAPNGEEAFETLRLQTIDLILLDLVMPGMGGSSFLQQLDQDPRFAHVPVLVITSEKSARESLKSDRPLRVLTKPVLPSELFASVNELLPALTDAAAVTHSA